MTTPTPPPARLTSYWLGSPNGWRGSSFQAASDEEAIALAEAPYPGYGEKVLDVMDWEDEDGNPVVLLVVADEASA